MVFNMGLIYNDIKDDISLIPKPRDYCWLVCRFTKINKD